MSKTQKTVAELSEKSGLAHAKAVAAMNTTDYAYYKAVSAMFDRLKKQI